MNDKFRNAQLRYDNMSPAEDSPFLSEEDVAELVMNTLENEVPSWLCEAIASAMETGDAAFLLKQCEKHIRPLIEEADREKREDMKIDAGEARYDAMMDNARGD